MDLNFWHKLASVFCIYLVACDMYTWYVCGGFLGNPFKIEVICNWLYKGFGHAPSDYYRFHTVQPIFMLTSRCLVSMEFVFLWISLETLCPFDAIFQHQIGCFYEYKQLYTHTYIYIYITCRNKQKCMYLKIHIHTPRAHNQQQNTANHITIILGVLGGPLLHQTYIQQPQPPTTNGSDPQVTCFGPHQSSNETYNT